MRTILIAAHKPPPFHGQSFMIQQLLEGLSAKYSGKINVIHLDVRFSTDITDIGRGGVRKILLLLFYAAKLVFFRIVHHPDLFYYVPAPGKRIAVYRDWCLVGLARLLGINRVLHWLAGGLAEWIETSAHPFERTISRFAYNHACLSIVTVESERANAAYFEPRQILRIPTGIPDPCPDFNEEVLPFRMTRFQNRMRLLHDFGFSKAIPVEKPSGHAEPSQHLNQIGDVLLLHALFMAHCSEDKGLFDAMEGVRIANERLFEEKIPMRIRLDVFGKFAKAEDKARFFTALAGACWTLSASKGPITLLTHCDFVSGEEKRRVFLNADVLCFPSFYAAEVNPTVIIDALANGLPVVTTKWRGIPELLPPDSLSPCEIQSPVQIAELLLEAATVANFQSYRDEYLKRFTCDVFVQEMEAAFQS